MTFRWFIYYCGMCGGCAAFVGWIIGRAMPSQSEVLQAGLQGLLLGMIVSLILALLDSLWNGGGGVARVMRVLAAMLVGGFGGFLGGLVGQALYNAVLLDWVRVLGWVITGLLVGVSLGSFDLYDRYRKKQPLTGARRKIQHGLIGGGLGGLIGGTLFMLLDSLGQEKGLWSASASGFVVLGILIGLMIGLAQVIMKEAWVKVEEGFRAGREIILQRPEVTVGRAEGCDIGLFGDARVEKIHARIIQRDGRYILEDTGSPHGTYVNGQRITGPTPLNNGDLIRMGRNILRFSERARR